MGLTITIGNEQNSDNAIEGSDQLNIEIAKSNLALKESSRFVREADESNDKKKRKKKKKKKKRKVILQRDKVGRRKEGKNKPKKDKAVKKDKAKGGKKADKKKVSPP